MFYKYEIKNNGIEDILYLHMSMKYDFSNELTLEDNIINASSQKFIKTNNIKFKGNKICIVVDGKIIKCMFLNKEQPKSNKLLVDNYMVNIYINDKVLYEISLREYLISVMLEKFIDNIHEETLKAIVVLYNSFAFKMMDDNNCILGNNRFVKYRTNEYYKENFKDFDKLLDKFNKIINEVDGVYLSYKNDYVLPFIHYSNNGNTHSNKNYPYLSSVRSLWDLASPHYIEIKDYTYNDINKIFNIDINHDCEFKVINDNYKKIKLGDNIFSIQEIKKMLNLKSSDIYIIVNNNYLRFITKGWGDAYGLSIFGANEIAKNDCKYHNILKYYFPKTTLLKKEL